MQNPRLKPSEVRTRIAKEHAHIRLLLTEIEALAARALCGGAESAARLHTSTVELYTMLEAHISLEDELLCPAIEEADAWGSIRAARMKEEHAAQRAALAHLARIEARENTAELARSLQALLTIIREDMCREDSELLDPDLLRDDVISIAQFSS
jgi:hypothetical protein